MKTNMDNNQEIASKIEESKIRNISKANSLQSLFFAVITLFIIIGVYYNLAHLDINKNKDNSMSKKYIEYSYDKNLNIISQQDNKVITNFNLKIADTNESRRNGLSNTKSLCDKCAMLFIFDTEDIYSFWMKDMNYNLDILYIKEEMIKDNVTGEVKTRKIISDIFENVKVSSYPNTVSNKNPAKYVLEINSGKVKDLNIKVGDEVSF